MLLVRRMERLGVRTRYGEPTCVDHVAVMRIVRRSQRGTRRAHSGWFEDDRDMFDPPMI